ncbi:hypothetical protein [Tuberibacillus sp. Marseille-P3662]|uniref:hypothetical protein n=1 Tax=Tuberibacillus sp. Marseille-P3662 TaxID=1965358 RepID=UPI000A1CD314|nr:hypothetical protein [Tuberibacillus sp. Marseille-P3662]
MLKDIVIRTESGFKVKKVSEEKMDREDKKFEKAFSDGVFAVPSTQKPNYRFQDLYNYALKKGVTPEQLGDEEWQMFKSDE